MKFLYTIVFALVFQFANAQVPGTRNINNALFAKFNLEVVVNDVNSVNFIINAVDSDRRITEVGVVYGFLKGLTKDSPSCNPYNSNFGTRIQTLSYTANEWSNTINRNVLSTAMHANEGMFRVAPYYARLYAIKNGNIYYGPDVEFLPNWPTAYETYSAKTWCKANLGAFYAATTVKDDVDTRGFLYQWGRGTDGHQFPNSPTTETVSTTDNPGHGSFIITPSAADWRSTNSDALWINGVNNPCPSGWRIGTYAEWRAVITNNSPFAWDSNKPFNSVLKLVESKGRSHRNGVIGNDINSAYWWNRNSAPYSIQIYNNGNYEENPARSIGGSVRCVQN